MVIEHKEKVKKHFDNWAEKYDQGHITEWLRFFQKRTINTISPRPDFKILDVGCGTGWAVKQLGKMIPGGSACGIDLSPAMIEQAKDNSDASDNVEFKTGDSENIPYEDELFDAVMCTSSFHHYPKPVRALSEFRRVLKPGGYAYVFDTCRDGSVLVFLYDLGHKLLVGDHIRYYHTDEIRGFFQEAGFADVVEEFKVQKLFLYKKILTSVVLMSARKGG